MLFGEDIAAVMQRYIYFVLNYTLLHSLKELLFIISSVGILDI
jgi:hypothetical protein